MGFEVTILGSGAALPTHNRNPSAQYINCNDRHILIDCGEATQIQIRKFHIKLQKISYILISHLHGDHFFGLVGLLSTFHLLGRDQGITIYGPEELESIVRSQLEIAGNRLGFDLVFVPLNGKEHKIIFEDRLIEIWAFPLNHRIPTNGFRIQEKPKERALDGDKFKRDGLSLTLIPLFKKGEDVRLPDDEILYADEYTFPAPETKSYSYCSDTLYDERIVPFIFKSTFLYHEATFLHNMIERAVSTRHTTAKQAAQIAKLAEVKHLLLGHLSARYDSGKAHQDEAREFFTATQVVEDGDCFQI